MQSLWEIAFSATGRSSAVPFVMIRSKSLPICNCLHVRRVNRPSGKITTLEGVPLFDTPVCGESLHPAAQSFVTIKPETQRYTYGVKLRSTFSIFPGLRLV